MKLLAILGIIILGQAASANTFSECILLQEYGKNLSAKAKRVEAKLVDEKCPKEQFRKTLNKDSDWAWVTDVKARQKCRESWRARHKFAYVDSLGNGYYSNEGISIAKDIENIKEQMDLISCPISNLRWAKRESGTAKCNFKLQKYGCSYNSYLEANPAMKEWGIKNPEMEAIERKKLQSID